MRTFHRDKLVICVFCPKLIIILSMHFTSKPTRHTKYLRSLQKFMSYWISTVRSKGIATLSTHVSRGAKPHEVPFKSTFSIEYVRSIKIYASYRIRTFSPKAHVILNTYVPYKKRIIQIYTSYRMSKFAPNYMCYWKCTFHLDLRVRLNTYILSKINGIVNAFVTPNLHGELNSTFPPDLRLILNTTFRPNIHVIGNTYFLSKSMCHTKNTHVPFKTTCNSECIHSV